MPAILKQDGSSWSETVPLHGFGGEEEVSFHPSHFTITISREAGSRGASIGKRVAKQLRWNCYEQEQLEVLAHKPEQRAELFAKLEPAAKQWVEDKLAKLRKNIPAIDKKNFHDLLQVILGIGCIGKAVIVGRGAGFILPRESTLHIRVIAPLRERVAWMRQQNRLTHEQARELVLETDKRRHQLFDSLIRDQSQESSLYDMLLNSSQLGETGCEELILKAFELKKKQQLPPTDSGLVEMLR